MVAVELRGEAQLRARFKAAARADFKETNQAAADLVRGESATRAPVRSGRLVASIRSSATSKQGVVRAGFSKLPYAGPIHFGWPKHHIAPNPFMYDALDERFAEVMEMYAERVQQLLEGGVTGG